MATRYKPKIQMHSKNVASAEDLLRSLEPASGQGVVGWSYKKYKDDVNLLGSCREMVSWGTGILAYFSSWAQEFVQTQRGMTRLVLTYVYLYLVTYNSSERDLKLIYSEISWFLKKICMFFNWIKILRKNRFQHLSIAVLAISVPFFFFVRASAPIVILLQF